MAEPSGPLTADQESLKFNIELLQKGLEYLEEHNEYTALFHRHERVAGELLEPQDIELKLRHEPFSVHMKWNDTGREVLFVEGANNNLMVVRLGGLRRMLGPIKITPNGSMAMRESRYPITEAGLKILAERLLEYRRRDLSLPGGVTCRVSEGHEFDGRDCYRFEIEYHDRSIEPEYWRTVALVDREWGLPLHIRNHEWPHGATGDTSDQATLIEEYAFQQIEFGTGFDVEVAARPERPQLSKLH